MDTSKEYIEMCGRAVEIQIEWKVVEGDFFVSPDGVKIVGMDYFKAEKIGDRRVRFYVFPKNKCISVEQIDDRFPNDIYFILGEGEYIAEIIHNAIWLPRQDQLQEMITVYDTMDDNKDEQLSSFYEFCFSGYWADEYHKRNRMSYEQLWLAFVMNKKYNKKWNGKNWE
jgi:hypothetical protein